MTSRRLWLLLGAAAPGLAGLGVSSLATLGVFPNLLWVGRYTADLAALAAAGGFGLSLVAAGAWAGELWIQTRVRGAVAKERERQATERRHFLRRLDHELKNPLTTICLGLANLQGDGRLPDEALSLKRIDHQVQRLHRLVEGLRRLAELDEAHLDRAQVSVPELLVEATELAKSTPEWSGRTVELRVQQVPWPARHVRGDRDLLVVALRNLVENALKFTAADDQVEARVVDDGRHAVVEVADTGPGIAPEDLPHIFDELFRGQNAQDVPGSGLGLALVRRIAALHGGQTEAHSRVGQGTVVRLSLPLDEA